MPSRVSALAPWTTVLNITIVQTAVTKETRFLLRKPLKEDVITVHLQYRPRYPFSLYALQHSLTFRATLQQLLHHTVISHRWLLLTSKVAAQHTGNIRQQRQLL